ncbi:helix-turn-helix transcriptional regulator [Nocardia cyriacigeorgica]|uniref:winged helix-turn-helix transcriptional regulator n=1 Tax=Nocardia cyriacigeorgica TaxID=135487 RepID=UPI0002F77A60|nr:helix-turn-helix domain-containing protein [Nocardia cyriacigeorgica]MBF6087469.1 helix-turn-helix transcriptional regulator [Nocardia cyriacigeorgica]MBF6092600.1 helix-turn-helix transcriptional regulator [Nocardia cyriacigeorgica]MBF6397177.1 helix-turn-helix transcriptional regulator [Nocardia cyriacigeorgica]MBF6403165.1 helix-turn-helix transcriptional regulator [Nocardia cyriacigeorgica]TLF58376.1 helix-turn-helix transcriptional regulator [Nocardia cyriacigeorgica]
MQTIVESSGLPADVYSAKCPTRQVLDHIAGKWTVLVVDALLEGTMRYTDLSRRIEGVSQKMLTQTLRSLEGDGFITRTVYPTIPPRVEYDLTALGRSLAEPITALRQWTEDHINEIEQARRRATDRPGEPSPSQH